MCILTLLVLVLATPGWGEDNTTANPSTTSTETTLNCKGQQYRNDSVSKCFWMLNNTYTQAGAIVGCVLDGGVLATIDSQSEADFVHNTFYPNHVFDGAWLGIVFDGTKWKKMDDSEAGMFRNWAPDHPKALSSISASKNCAMIDISTYLWKSVPCEERAFVLCESQDYSVRKRVCGWDWTFRKCFWLLTNKYTRLEAINECWKDKGILSTIDSADENDKAVIILKDFYQSYGSIWLGVAPHDGVWKSMSGRKLTWFAWSSSEPDYQPDYTGGFDKACVAMDIDTSKWFSVYCFVRRHTLCENSDNGVLNSGISHTASQQRRYMNVTENVTEAPVGTSTTEDSLSHSISISATSSYANTTYFTPENTASTTVTCYTLTNGVTANEQTLNTEIDLSALTDSTGTLVTVTQTLLTASLTVEVSVTASPTPTGLSQEELTRKIKETQQELKVDKEELSSTKRKRQCASDPRVSSISIGALSVILLLLSFLVPVAVDVPKYYRDLRKGAALKSTAGIGESISMHGLKGTGEASDDMTLSMDAASEAATTSEAL